MPLPADATLDYLVTRLRWSRRYIPDVFANMDGLDGDCQVRLAVDCESRAADYRIERLAPDPRGSQLQTIRIMDGIYHNDLVARPVDGRVWSSKAMTWREVRELVEWLPGMLPKIAKVVDADGGNEEDSRIMRTIFLLMAQYDGAAIIPVASVVKDYFPHLTVESFVRKATIGEIKLPVVRIEISQKAARGVHVNDLAKYIDARWKVAKGELAAFLRGA